MYGEALSTDLAESSTLDPSNPYSASKAAAEMILKGYVKSHKLPAVAIRLNNVVGPHQYPESKVARTHPEKRTLTYHRGRAQIHQLTSTKDALTPAR